MTLACLTSLSFALTFWRWIASRRFPLHERIPSDGAGEGSALCHTPGLTLL
jgi:hypothetical protein